MSIQLQPYSTVEIPAYIQGVRDRFARAIEETGVPKEKACVYAASKVAEFFPQDKPNNLQHVFHIVNDNQEEVGCLWLAVMNEQELRVADIAIHEANRGNGCGRQAMLLVEDFAKQHGYDYISLNVFSHNKPAFKLYESLGYVIQRAQDGKNEMRKIIGQ